MKQQPTPEQWNELSNDEQDIFYKWLLERDGYWEIGGAHVEPGIPVKLNIGHMIEFLRGGYWAAMDIEGEKKSFYVMRLTPEEELCDALWEACKYKLRNHE
jgi:hypothetical protein